MLITLAQIELRVACVATWRAEGKQTHVLYEGRALPILEL
jgi:hypothetical protein